MGKRLWTDIGFVIDFLLVYWFRTAYDSCQLFHDSDYKCEIIKKCMNKMKSCPNNLLMKPETLERNKIRPAVRNYILEKSLSAGHMIQKNRESISWEVSTGVFKLFSFHSSNPVDIRYANTIVIPVNRRKGMTILVLFQIGLLI